MNAPGWLTGLQSLYRGLLRLYPPAFYERFAAEMDQVFCLLSRHEYQRAGAASTLGLGLLSLADSLLAAARQWGAKLFNRRIAMDADGSELRAGMSPLPTGQTALAVLPFLLYGLACMLAQVWHPAVSAFPPPVWEIFLKLPYLWFAVFCLVGLLAGLLMGFPRWAQPYLGWTLWFCWWWRNMSTYTYRWDARVWLAPLGVLLLAMLVRRSLRPVRDLLSSLWQDWTLPSLALFIFYCGVSILFDENHHPLLLLFMAAVMLAGAAGAWAYYRLRFAFPRVFALGAALLAMAFLQIWCYGTWDFRAYYHLGPGPKFDWGTLWASLLWAGVLLLPALAAWLRARRGLRKAKG